MNVSDNPLERLNFIIDFAWDIFLKRIAKEKIKVNKEASMQLHYASILHMLGELMCVTPDEKFDVQLESKYEKKNIDITCTYNNICAAIEAQQANARICGSRIMRLLC